MAAAEAEAKTGAALDIGADVTMAFDPTNPADMKRLEGLVGDAAGNLLASQAGPLLAPLARLAMTPVVGGPALAEALEHNFESVTLGAATSGYASAEGNLSALGTGPNAEAGLMGTSGVSVTEHRDGSLDLHASFEYAGKGSASLAPGAEAGGGLALRADLELNLNPDKSFNAASVQVTGSATVDGQAAFVQNSRTAAPSAKLTLTAAGVQEMKTRLGNGEDPVVVARDLFNDPAKITVQAQVTLTNTFGVEQEFSGTVATAKIGGEGGAALTRSQTIPLADNGQRVERSDGQGFWDRSAVLSALNFNFLD